MSFGLFESALGSEQEVGLARQASLDKKAAAIYDVREKLGPSLFASRSIQEFRDRVAMMKADQSIYKIIGAHIHPANGVVRSIVGKNSVLEKEYKAMLTAGLITAADDEDDLEDRTTVTDDQKEDIANGERADDVETNSGDGSDADGDDPDDTDDDDTYKAARRLHRADKKAGASRRRADFSGTVDTEQTFTPSDDDLIPEDNWDAYLNKVDQDSSKVERNFTSARTAWTLFSDWCEANNTTPRLAALDVYSTHLPDAQYFKLARLVQAWEHSHQPKVPGGQSQSKLKDVTAAADVGLAMDPGSNPSPSQAPTPVPTPDLGTANPATAPTDPILAYTAWCERNGYKKISARNAEIFAATDPQLCYYLAHRLRQALRVAWKRQASHRTAAPDYLQKADDALTQLLNQKAEEFQQTIAPLQQALVTVQQAEQLQQQSDPLNVMPPPGTVNVLPGGDQGPAGMPAPGAQDLGPAAAALAGAGGAPPGGAPDGGMGMAPPPGGDPSAGGPPPGAADGGLPPELSQQMMARRKRGGSGKG